MTSGRVIELSYQCSDEVARQAVDGLFAKVKERENVIDIRPGPNNWQDDGLCLWSYEVHLPMMKPLYFAGQTTIHQGKVVIHYTTFPEGNQLARGGWGRTVDNVEKAFKRLVHSATG